MMKLVSALASVALVASPVLAKSPQCRDAKGHFAKASECAKAAPAAAGDETPTAANMKKDAKGRCHWTTTTAKHKAGQLVKCP